MNILINEEYDDLSTLILDTNIPYRESITGSSTCSTKELSITMTNNLSAVNEWLQLYVYSRSYISQMWILKNSKDLSDNVYSRTFSEISSIQTFDFSTLYHIIPHEKLNPVKRKCSHRI
jgi:hypothetical protein